MKRIVVALGGNAILNGKEEGTFLNQYRNIERTSSFLLDLIKEGYELVVAHGNGPQVGELVLQNELAQAKTPPMPLPALTAQTQGLIGYMLEESLSNKLMEAGMNKEVTTVLTRVEVSLEDEAFKDPSKPIGSFYTREEAEKYTRERGWTLKEDANRGYRRVVYSPKPKRVLAVESIKGLLAIGNVVIAGGGGGIPVVLEDGSYRGVDAVVDKDFSSCKMAEELGADIFMILTDVENVYLNYGREDQKKLGQVSLEEMKGYIRDGEFSEGSMLPKVLAAVEFASLGKESYICSLDQAKDALLSRAGTRISL